MNEVTLQQVINTLVFVEINTLQEKKIMSSHKINYIYNFIEQIYF